MRRRIRCDRGYATVWVVTAIALVVVATAVAAGYAGTVLARHRAATAADAAALAAALSAIEGPVAACARGSMLARLNGASMARCTMSGPVAEVVVEVRLPGPLERFGVAMQQARAGPASVESPPIPLQPDADTPEIGTSPTKRPTS